VPAAATIVPADSDLLCEGCGYTLNGLPTTGNCPECGKPIAESIGTHRSQSPFERDESATGFLRTFCEVIFRPGQFYQTLETRSANSAAQGFSFFNRLLASMLFAATAIGHLMWLSDRYTRDTDAWDVGRVALIWFLLTLAILGILYGLNVLATWLSALEARYWGMRLPYPVVRRGLLYHSAHYIPVSAMSVGIVWTYRVLSVHGVLDGRWDTTYLYTLCAAVIVSAVYLFQTYWIAMRNMRYANR